MLAFNSPYLTGRELSYLSQVIESGQFSGAGSFTQRVQELLENRYGAPKVLLTHSCTAALEMSALLLDLEPGDEVIVPSYTFCTTASAFLRTPATVVFCEVDPTDMMIAVADVEARITSKTRAIVPVHYGGLACNMPVILELARKHGLSVVEDAAQGLEASLSGRPLGRWGDVGCISFHETKNLHAGLAGALFINESFADKIERATRIWERGTNRQAKLKGLVDKYTWTDVGSSFYPTELQAAFLLAQLESVDENLREREQICRAYDEALTPLSQSGAFDLPQAREGLRTNYHAYFLIFPSVETCDTVRQTLSDAEMAAYIGYVPLHSSPMGQKLGWNAEDLPITEEMAPRVLRLPLHNSMTADDARRVGETIAACYNGGTI
jgi:dTDP-4-amino-4,6-dideoxygalactose transaminase